MPGNIWVVAEHWQGSPTDAAFEALALGRELADGLGVALEAVVLGSDTGGLAAALGAADRIVAVDHPALSDPIGDVAARTIAALAAERRPEVVLVPITNLGWDLIGLLPARIGCPMVNFVQDASVVDGRIEAASLVYGGKMSTRVAVPAGPAVLAVLPGTRPAEAGRITGPPPVDRVAMDVDPGLIEFCGYREPEAGDVDITRQDVLVAIGRGIGGQGNVELAEELAELLGGAVCGSRPVIDQGWLPMSRQVGKSGHQVKPKLYLALGVSGAPEHVEGMRDAELIIAVNSDPDAPIFRVAHYGVGADLLDVVPELIDRLEAAGKR